MHSPTSTLSKKLRLSILAPTMVMGGLIALPHIAMAQQAKPTPAPAAQSDKLDVRDLEKKYWASKDTDFSVVQNRTYSKVHRFSIAAQYGTPVSDAYSDGSVFTFSGNYYFSERYGVELQGTVTNLHDNDSLKSFEHLPSSTGVRPNYNKMGDFYGASFNWVPIYAKMSLLNSSVIYFDMAFSPGFGIQTYNQEIEPSVASTATDQRNRSGAAAQFAVTQHYFFTNHFALRVDWTHRWTSEKTAVWTANPDGSHAESSGVHHDSVLSGGLTYFF